MRSLADEVRRVAGIVAAAVPPAEAGAVRTAAARLDEPLRVAVAGRVKAGKSTLVNALVGQHLAATDAAECTRCVMWYRDGPRYGATLFDTDGGRHELALVVDGDRASVDLAGHRVEDVDRVEVTYPSQHLRQLTLIDTPGVASISEQVSARAGSFLAPASGDGGADVVVYLMRHLHQADRDFLEAFTDASAATDPVRSVAVLGRADELGAGRGDAMELARHVAAGYQADPAVSRRVTGVMPVSGLLALTAATLRQQEFDHLAALAALPVAATDRLCVSADRFTADSAACPVSSVARASLLDRLGVFGVRSCLAGVRSGRIATVDDLEAELRRLSGIGPLRTLLLERFAARADVLKAARALATTRTVAERAGVPGEVLQEVGRVEANAHELEELRCLRLLAEGSLRLPAAVHDVVLAALGGTGPSPWARTGLGEGDGDGDRGCADRARALVAELRRHRARPLLSSEAARVLDGAVRSLERVHASLVPRRT